MSKEMMLVYVVILKSFISASSLHLACEDNWKI